MQYDLPAMFLIYAARTVLHLKRVNVCDNNLYLYHFLLRQQPDFFGSLLTTLTTGLGASLTMLSLPKDSYGA